MRPDDEADLAVEAITTAATRGLRVPAAWMRERMGIPEPRDGEEVLSGLPVGRAGDAADGGGEDGGAPPTPHALGLHAAADPWGGADWLGLAEDVAAPVLAALDAAANASEFVALASEAGTPAALAEDLARRCFGARVDGEAEG